MSPWLYALLATELIWIGAVLFLLVSAFRVSLKWGLISFFVPFGILVFTVKYWSVAGVASGDEGRCQAAATRANGGGRYAMQTSRWVTRMARKAR